jgi:hypothetical protein
MYIARGICRYSFNCLVDSVWRMVLIEIEEQSLRIGFRKIFDSFLDGVIVNEVRFSVYGVLKLFPT